MKTSAIIADRYAKALFQQATEKGAAEAVLAELLKIKEMVDSHESLRRAFYSPVVSRASLMNTFSHLFKQLKISALTSAFMGTLAKNRRTKAFDTIVDSFAEKVRSSKGFKAIDIFTATPLSAARQKKLVASLEKAIGQKIDATIAIDPKLIGGIKLQIGSTLIDQSIEGQLNKLQLALKGE